MFSVSIERTLAPANHVTVQRMENDVVITFAKTETVYQSETRSALVSFLKARCKDKAVFKFFLSEITNRELL